MVYLILAVLCSSSNSLIIKFHESRSNNKISLIMMNYVMAVIFGSVLSIGQIKSINIENLGLSPAFAVINGIFYVSTFLLLQLNIRKNGATISASLSHMGLVIPVLLSIFLFGEYPRAVQTVGVLVALASLVVISFPGKSDISTPEHPASKSSSAYRWLLIPMFLASGLGDTMSKVFEAYCDHTIEDLFISATFVVALAVCVVVYFIKHERMERFDAACGMVLGVTNYLSTKFLIKAIYTVPAFMAYISFGLGIVMFINCVNVLVLHEKLSKRDYIGMLLSMGAIVLLNL